MSGPPTRRDNGSVAQTAKPMRKREQRIRLVVVVTVVLKPALAAQGETVVCP